MSHVRWMIRRDFPEVMDIEKHCFEFPWQESDFIRCLRQRNCIGMVSEGEDELIEGFMIYEMHPNMIHVLNFAVHTNFRRKGVGVQMVQKLKGKLTQQRRNRIALEVRETNLQAQQFFRSQGFSATGIARNHYDDSTDDAYTFEHRIESPALLEPNNRISGVMQ